MLNWRYYQNNFITRWHQSILLTAFVNFGVWSPSCTCVLILNYSIIPMGFLCLLESTQCSKLHRQSPFGIQLLNFKKSMIKKGFHFWSEGSMTHWKVPNQTYWTRSTLAIDTASALRKKKQDMPVGPRKTCLKQLGQNTKIDYCKFDSPILPTPYSL